VAKLVDEARFVTVKAVADECGVTVPTVHSWLKYHRFMPFHSVFGRILIDRSDYARFKSEHPDLLNKKARAKAEVAA
jgi:DeoR/GlpR family transcriptional regulator of sugar metabolism